MPYIVYHGSNGPALGGIYEGTANSGPNPLMAGIGAFAQNFGSEFTKNRDRERAKSDQKDLYGSKLEMQRQDDEAARAQQTERNRAFMQKYPDLMKDEAVAYAVENGEDVSKVLQWRHSQQEKTALQSMMEQGRNDRFYAGLDQKAGQFDINAGLKQQAQESQDRYRSGMIDLTGRRADETARHNQATEGLGQQRIEQGAARMESQDDYQRQSLEIRRKTLDLQSRALAIRSPTEADAVMAEADQAEEYAHENYRRAQAAYAAAMRDTTLSRAQKAAAIERLGRSVDATRSEYVRATEALGEARAAAVRAKMQHEPEQAPARPASPGLDDAPRPGESEDDYVRRMMGGGR